MIPDFEVTILGNTSSIPVHGRNPTAQVVRYGQELFLLDCGEGTQVQLRKHVHKPTRINHIFISHLHGDHYLGLVGLLSSLNLIGRTKTLWLYGPKGLDEIITTQFKWSNTRLSYPLHFTETNPNEKATLFKNDSIQIDSFPMKHRLPTTGFVVKETRRLRNLIKEKLEERKPGIEAIKAMREGNDFENESGEKFYVEEFAYPAPDLRSYAFCSDTIFDPEIIKYIKDVNLLYHESTFMEDLKERAKVTFHSTAKEAAEIARRSDVGSLLLGHFSSRYSELDELLAEATSVFPRTVLSHQGETYQLI